MIRRMSYTSAVLASFIAAPAFAGSLSTSFALVGAAQIPYCIITNVDAKSFEVSVEALNYFGATRTPNLANCPIAPATLDPGETCFSEYDPGSDLVCRFSAKGKVRASVQVTDSSGNIISAIPATAK